MPVNVEQARRQLQEFDFVHLLVQELGWNHHTATPLDVIVDGATYTLGAVAEKCGLVVYTCAPGSDGGIPLYPVRRKIERRVAKSTYEHLIIFTDAARATQVWQWVKRQTGSQTVCREQVFRAGQTGEALLQKLERLAFELEEEERLSIAVVADRVRKALDIEKVTKKFYARFKNEHDAFLRFIRGIRDQGEREWYASLTLNRLMFVYFIQKKGFLDGNTDYLRDRLRKATPDFFRRFLLRMFHEGLGKPEGSRPPDLSVLLGRVPYLDGGLFDVHELEQKNPDIQISDGAFERVFDFFDAYTWHLDERPLRADNEINPDVLGYIFEKYVNQKQMGAYYTKEDITGYISRNTIIPYIFEAAKKECPIAFVPDGGVWRLLKDDPDRYIYPAVRKGVDLDLPENIAAGLNDVSKRIVWNSPAPEEYALPTETWREHVARRRRCLDLRAKIAAGSITSIDDLTTHNLDICRFAEDVIINSEGPELVRAFWRALEKVSVLDPTCGSGAFLFAALNILDPLYSASLEGMQGFLDDLERSGRRHHPDMLRPFRDTLDRVAKHPHRRYFILKSIVVNNLYGVDIMEEAVEICKLRLFLKLVAQLENVEQIEPLPDIDFNIRAGNTLVGFTSLDAVRDAITTMAGGQKRLLLSAEEEATLRRIEEDAEVADRAFQKFRQMQTAFGMDAEEFANAKIELRRRLDGLRVELDRYLASEYGVKAQNHAAFVKWRDNHQPFHWFTEFYGVMSTGGFNIVIGNPPWKEYSAVRKEYTVRSYSTEPCGNLYGFCIERSLGLWSAQARFSFIVQLPLVSSSRMDSVRRVLCQKSTELYALPFDDRPGKLFDGLEHSRATIFVAKAQNRPHEPTLLTARYQRWFANTREHLFARVEYFRQSEQPLVPGVFPKHANKLHEWVFSRQRLTVRQAIVDLTTSNETRHFVFYQEATQYWVKATYGLPFYAKNGAVGAPAHGRYLYFPDQDTAHAICAVLNSSFFYLYFITYGDCFHLSERLVAGFPLNSGVINEPRLKGLNRQLMADLLGGAERKTIRTKDGDSIAYDEFYVSRSKRIIDEIDRALADHYGFTDEELDFIVNYDIKYRLGQNEVDEDDGL